MFLCNHFQWIDSYGSFLTVLIFTFVYKETECIISMFCALFIVKRKTQNITSNIKQLQLVDLDQTFRSLPIECLFIKQLLTYKKQKKALFKKSLIIFSESKRHPKHLVGNFFLFLKEQNQFFCFFQCLDNYFLNIFVKTLEIRVQTVKIYKGNY